MKNLIVTALMLFTVGSCTSQKNAAEESETLPKDVALKPEKSDDQEREREEMTTLIKEIDAMIAKESCTDAADWKFTAVGAKPCGGPSSYLAYPKSLEKTVLPKIAAFTSMQSAYNSKYGLMSDCAMVLPPAEIRCENGKAVLVSAQSDAMRLEE